MLYILLVLISALLVMGASFLFLFWGNLGIMLGYRPKVVLDEYVMYETAFAEKWYDSRLIGPCSYCGMSDAPLVRPLKHFGGISTKCKWCAELHNITHHLKIQGRLIPTPPKDSGGGSVLNFSTPNEVRSRADLSLISTELK